MEFAQACMCDRTPFLKEPGIAYNSTKSAKTFKSFISLFTASYIFVIVLFLIKKNNFVWQASI